MSKELPIHSLRRRRIGGGEGPTEPASCSKWSSRRVAIRPNDLRSRSAFCSGVTFPPHAGYVLSSVDFCSSLIDKSQVVRLGALCLVGDRRPRSRGSLECRRRSKWSAAATPGQTARLTPLMRRMSLWRRWRTALRAITDPSRPLRRANNVVAPLRWRLRLLVAHLPCLRGRLGCERSRCESGLSCRAR